MVTIFSIHNATQAFFTFRKPIHSSYISIQIETTFAGKGMARKTKAARLREQRERQQEVRNQQKADKRPGRDDFARYAFRWMILKAADTVDEDQGEMHKLEIALIDGLVKQGFDRDHTKIALRGFIEKYLDEGWDFRIKRHLDAPLSLLGFPE